MKKYIKKILFFAFICFSFFLVDTFIVNAATLGAFGGLNINSSKVISGNNGYSTGQGYYVTPSSNAKNFVEYTFCLSDVLDFYSIAVAGSISGDPVTVAYPKTSCQVNGSTLGFIEKIYINVLSYDDAGNGNYGLTLDSSIFNRHSYAVSVKLIAVSSVDTITYDNTSDIINQNQTIINQNQQTIQKQQETTNAVNDVNDTLKDDDIDSSNTTDTLEDLSDSLPTNSVISDLLLLPVRLFQSVLNSVNGTCTTFNLGSLFGTNLTLPCIDIENLVGSTLWTVIDILFCGAFILVIRKKFVDIFESLSNLKNGGNEVE